MSEEEPKVYSMRQASERLGVSVEEIARYVEEGLVVSDESAGGEGGFSRVQMRRLWSIVSLHRDLGINLPGVEAILQLREQYERIRRDLAVLVEIVERELGEEAWDRLWPKDRPRPSVEVNVKDTADLPGSAEAQPTGEAPAGEGGEDPA